MLKNKIYKYLSNEILKNFITILLTFTAIAWVVRAVNFLDLMVEDGYTSNIYFKYSILNLTTIITRFVPLSFLLSLTISIIKFEKQQELLILWASGLTKIKIANIFLLIAIFITILQLTLSTIVNPYLLNKSRSLLKDSKDLNISSVLRSNDFSDTFKGITFYVERKNSNDELINIFIKDIGGNLNTISSKKNESKNLTIIAKKGFITNDKLVLFNGVIQTLNLKNEFNNIQFEKTELSLIGISTRTIKKPKIQETTSRLLLKCLFNKNKDLIIDNCSRGEVIQNLSRRLGTPIYIPLITIITSFLLIYKKETKFNYLNKYILFSLSFLMLVVSEIFLKYTGLSNLTTISYFVLPLLISVFSYIFLIKKMTSKRTI
jgi:lipopolysaccharide export system permease protein